MSQNEWDDLFAGGAETVKFPAIGASIKGTIVKIDVGQQRDVKDGSPLFWDDGNPRKQVIFTLATDLRNDADDNGERRLFAPVPGGVMTALRAALGKAGAKTPEVGGKLAVAYVADGEKSNPAFNAPKVYEARYKAPEPVADVFADMGVNTSTGEISAPAQAAPSATAQAAQSALDSLDF